LHELSLTNNVFKISHIDYVIKMAEVQVLS